MHSYDIKLVDKEITPFREHSLFLKLLEKCHFEEQPQESLLPSQSSNKGYKPSRLISETTCKAEDWEEPRCIVMIRKEIETRPKAAGKQVKQIELFGVVNDFGKNRYSCLVANLNLPAKLYTTHIMGGLIQKIESRNWNMISQWMTSCRTISGLLRLVVIMAYNFMPLLRYALINSDKKQFLKIIRYELNSTPTYLGKTKDMHILYSARSLNTRQAFLSIWEN